MTSPGSSFRWLPTGEVALGTMLEAIRTAQHSVRLETYIFDGGPLGQSFRGALVRACSRHVRVQVLVDAVGSISLGDSFWEPLRQAGGQVRWFNPLSLERLSYRDHRKNLVVDDARAFVGGCNIATEYFGDGVLRGWRDLGLAITGPLALELAAAFDQMYERADFQHRRFQRLRRRRVEDLAADQNWHLLLSGPGRGHCALKRSLAADLAQAWTVNVATAYFLPTWRIRRELRRAARRGGRVQLILAGQSDVKLSQLASRRLYHGLLRAGVEIYEYQPQILHTKLVIVDDVAYAGSANLDARSLSINYELLVRVQSAELAAQARDIFADCLTHSRRIDPAAWPRSRSFFQKLLERWACFILMRVDPHLARWQLRSLRRHARGVSPHY